MTATDQLRAALRDLEAKARELELEKKLEAFAEKADHYLREAAVKAGDYAHDNRDRVEGALASAGSKVDEKTDGKYHRTVEKLKTGVLGGVDWVAEQRDSSSTPTWAQGSRWGAEPGAGDTACRGHAMPVPRLPMHPPRPLPPPAPTLPRARPTRTRGSTSPTPLRRRRARPTRRDAWFEVIRRSRGGRSPRTAPAASGGGEPLVPRITSNRESR